MIYTAGARLRASDLAELTAAAGSWTAWIPTWTNLTLGNGVVSARYRQVGKSVDYRLKFTLGSSSAVGSGPTFTLPLTPLASAYNFDDPIGVGDAINAGISGTTGVGVRYNGSGVGRFVVTATSPITFGTGDVLSATFTYETA